MRRQWLALGHSATGRRRRRRRKKEVRWVKGGTVRVWDFNSCSGKENENRHLGI